MLLGSSTLKEDLDKLEKIAKNSWITNNGRLFMESIFVTSDLTNNDSVVYENNEVFFGHRIENNVLKLYTARNETNDNGHIFPYITGNVCPGFCIVGRRDNTVILTESLSGCSIYIYDIGNYRIYVHNEHLSDNIQLKNSNCCNLLLAKLSGYFGEDIKKEIDFTNPTYKIEGSINVNGSLCKSEYNRLEYLIRNYNRNLKYFYHLVIRQKEDCINCFFFPSTFGTETPVFEGNFLLEIHGAKKTLYTTTYDGIESCTASLGVAGRKYVSSYMTQSKYQN